METYITTTTNAGKAGKNNLVNRISTIMAAWEQLAAESKFAGMTFTDFRLAMIPAMEGDQRKKLLNLEMKAAVRASANADAPCRAINNRVVAAVLADGAFGPDSPLYRAMGFVPKSERKRGKKQPAVPTTAAGTTVG